MVSADYEDVLVHAGCWDADDRLECLRKVPYAVMKYANDKSPTWASFEVSRYSRYIYAETSVY